MSQDSRKRRIASVVAGSLLVAGSGLVAGIAMAGSASADDSVTSSTSAPTPGARVKDFMSTVLADLVGKGTITAAQRDAITAGIDAKVAADAQARAQFRTQADALIAKAHGLSVEEFKVKREARTLTPLTQEQRTALEKELQALATSLGLPADGPWMRGPGLGQGKDRGMGMGRDGHGRGQHSGGQHGHGFGDRDGDRDGNGPTGGVTNNSTSNSPTSSSNVGG